MYIMGATLRGQIDSLNNGSFWVNDYKGNIG